MRALENEREFSQFLLQIGNGTYPTKAGTNEISLPENIVVDEDESTVAFIVVFNHKWCTIGSIHILYLLIKIEGTSMKSNE